MKNRIARQAEPFENFFPHTTDISVRINHQRAEVASILGRFAILVNKLDPSEDVKGVKQDFLADLLKTGQKELNKWHQLLELYLSNPQATYESPRKHSKVIALEQEYDSNKPVAQKSRHELHRRYGHRPAFQLR